MMRQQGRTVITGCVLALSCVFASVGAGSASAAGIAGWTVRSVALPTNFSTSDNKTCEEARFEICDSYLVTVTNVGTAASIGTVTIEDTLPVGLEPEHVRNAEDFETGESLACSSSAATATVRCSESKPVAPGDMLEFFVTVMVTGSARSVTNVPEVEEGGAVVARASEPSTVANMVNGSAPSFGVQDFSIGAFGSDGQSDTLAGDHPDALMSVIDYKSDFTPNNANPSSAWAAVAEPKSEIVALPLGLLGDPLAAAQCPESELRQSRCPADSEIGIAAVIKEGAARVVDRELGEERIFNMVPEPGEPALFAFEYTEADVFLRTRVIPSPSGYMVSIAVPAVPRAFGEKVTGVSLTFFGDPNEQNGGGDTRTAFFTNPSDCSAGPLDARLEMDSWVKPGEWVAKETPVYQADAQHAVTGCSMLQFDPSIEVAPEQTQADTPSGYQADLKVPQAPNRSPALATPDLKNAEVKLPEGVTLSAGAGTGLAGCEEAGPEGINITHGWTPTGAQPLDPADPEAMEIAPDGLPHVAPGHCPPASQIGTAEVKTPLLAEPLTGHVYLAQPGCGGTGQSECTPASAEDGQLYGIYLEVAGSGVIIKLRGKVSVNAATGQTTTTFSENPQLPFEELRLNLNGGPRAPLANPQTCGLATTTSSLEPWSAPGSGPNATPSSTFQVGGCGSSTPFKPGFEVGSVQTRAGAFSAFTMTLTRKDGEQDIGGVSLTMPEGSAGFISKVAQCPEAQANAGTCPQSSRIGTAHVAAGAGSLPLWLEGSVYLTGPYKGDPFGLSVVVPAKAGPYNLGNEVVRAGISVDPHSGQVSIASEPLRLIRDGVPFRLKELNITVDKQGFMFNPTDCSQLAVTGEISGDMPDGSPGSSVAVSDPFAVAGCKNLPFHPTFKAETHRYHSRKKGAFLRVRITSGEEQANLAKVHVTLPKALPSELSTLKQACTEAQFVANPAGCPKAAFVGNVVVHTPVLNQPLKGPAIFVSHGHAAFPDLDLVLQGEGVTIIQEGHTNIHKGFTSSSFDAIPDLPVKSIVLTLPETEKPALGGNGSFCKKKLRMPTTITGQNGAVIEKQTKIKVKGCKASRAKRKRKARKGKKAAAKHRKHGKRRMR